MEPSGATRNIVVGLCCSLHMSRLCDLTVLMVEVDAALPRVWVGLEYSAVREDCDLHYSSEYAESSYNPYVPNLPRKYD